MIILIKLFFYSNGGRRAVTVQRNAVDWADLAWRYWSSGLTTWEESPLYNELLQPTELRWNRFDIGFQVFGEIRREGHEEVILESILELGSRKTSD